MPTNDIIVEARDEELLRRLVSGQSVKQAAEEMGWHSHTLRSVAQRPEFKAKARATIKNLCLDWDLAFEDQGSELQKLLKDNAMDAVNEIARIMHKGSNDRVRLAASCEILDRSDLGLESKKT